MRSATGGLSARTGALITAIAAIALILVWQLVAGLWLQDLGVIAAPLSIAQSLVQNFALYNTAFWATATSAMLGWFWGNLLAIIAAVLFVQFRSLEQLFLRLALTLFCLPLVALMPILQLTFEVDESKVILAALSVFFTTLVGTMLGLRSAEAGSLTMVHAWGGGPFGALRFIKFPTGIPAILTGMQIGAAAAVLGATFGEFIGASKGLGVLIVNGLNTMNLDMVWSVAVLATVMAGVPYVVFGMLRSRLVPWAQSTSTAVAAPLAAPRKRPLAVRFLIGLGWALGSIAVILLGWWLYLVVFDVAPFVGKSPVAVFEYLFTDADAAANRAPLLDALGVTLVHSGVGYLAGMVLGVVVAILFSVVPVAERIFAPLAIALRSVPIIVLTPLLILMLGRGLGGVVAITAIVTFFPTLANTQGGLQRVPRDAMLIMRSYDASFLSSLFRVQLPYALPAVFASARIAAPAAVLAATLAEWLATGDGLGYAIVIARAHSSYIDLWSAAAILTLVSVLAYSAVSIAERAVLARFAPGQLR